ncbi:E3 ubiquitin-protein ligase UPL7 isoform X1 [Cryptomeria japonica]|uniref:E3 ubiquitin-protein ligase UPL7 isoform X1 n=2 Tax=Cryptomeria japonica TaxID=3369 RepID=UPI0027DA79A3|nr:E3 ubiquitin-protein ligase UPL7 isoform X1 [Cryptomeria japonica]
MDRFRKQEHQVSLRGASAKEITRDALLEKVMHERELRNHAKRATAAALFIQRVWRAHYAAKCIAEKFRTEWDAFVAQFDDVPLSAELISKDIVRPFLFFMSGPLKLCHQVQGTDDDQRMVKCFRILLQSISCPNAEQNFCSLAFNSVEEHAGWFFQACKLLSICFFTLTKDAGGAASVVIALATRLMVSLTDVNTWNHFVKDHKGDGSLVAWKLINWISIGNASLYSSVRQYMMKHNSPLTGKYKSVGEMDESFIITASAITMVLRPFCALKPEDFKNIHSASNQSDYPESYNAGIKGAAEQFCVYILTIPHLTQRLPAVLMPALQHTVTFSHFLKTLVISKEVIFPAISNLDQLNLTGTPSSVWALVNIVSLASVSDESSEYSGHLVKGLDCSEYVFALCSILEDLMPWIENNRQIKRKMAEDEETFDENHVSAAVKHYSSSNANNEDGLTDMNLSFIEFLRPLYQQWHLQLLLNTIKKDSFPMHVTQHNDMWSQEGMKRKLELQDVAQLYSYLIAMFSAFNSSAGPLPILNLLAFTQGFLSQLWEWLQQYLSLNKASHSKVHKHAQTSTNSGGNQIQGTQGRKEESLVRNVSSKWASAFLRMKGRSSNEDNTSDMGKDVSIQQCTDKDNVCQVWDLEPMKRGPQGIPKNTSTMLLLFCATYAHLLMVLDDEEFYEKQVPFTLEQQKTIAAMLNTMVYNGFLSNAGNHSNPLMEAAVRCLHFLYERDCRRSFCPPSLWLAPAVKYRPPVAAAARAHEAVATSLKLGGSSVAPLMGSLVVTVPHVFPFEERVQMFREFVKADKASRRMMGEVAGPGPGSIEIAVRRDHIVEDGFNQLNLLGSKLKSCINVSFVNECGLPEAGLDYGGLFKEFLTDLAKAAFDPRYGLFLQTLTDERLLFPHPPARLLGNGVQMIEFLGRVVGKALYEGILLDYCFSHVFVRKLLGRYSFLDELSGLDPELHRNLMYLKHYEGDVKDLALDFTVMEDIFGKRVVIELRPGGSNMPVTIENRLQYIHAMADYKLNRQIQPLINAFYRGLSDLISPSWLCLFNAQEFNQLLSGGEHDFDVDDLKSNTRYSGGYSESSRTVKLFWEVVKGLEPGERSILLKFVTSCSRAPLLGFKHLQPPFTIHKVVCDTPVWAMIGGQDVERLPSASTCYNTLKLPTYKRLSTLRNKLLYAIQANAGFELS